MANIKVINRYNVVEVYIKDYVNQEIVGILYDLGKLERDLHEEIQHEIEDILNLIRREIPRHGIYIEGIKSISADVGDYAELYRLNDSGSGMKLQSFASVGRFIKEVIIKDPKIRRAKVHLNPEDVIELLEIVYTQLQKIGYEFIN